MSQIYLDDGPPACPSWQKVMLATTVYDRPDAGFAFSVQRGRAALEAHDIDTAYLILEGNCHVDDARNVVVQNFLLSDCTDLVFIDADVLFEPEDLVTLCKYAADLVGGVYPFRRADAQTARGMPVRMIPGVSEPNDEGLLEVEGLPTGFMRIRRRVLEALAADADHFWNRNDTRSQVPILFGRTYRDGNRVGGDIAFCQKWRSSGGKVYAAPEMRLGHAAKVIVRDSLAAALRRQSNTTLAYVADRIRAQTEDVGVLREARTFLDNPFGAIEDVLLTAILCARQADGDILEAGSGLTTIVMAAAAPEQTVYCLEHDPVHAARVEQMAYQAGVGNIAIVTCALKDGWYEIDDQLPPTFALGLNDGPPRLLGDRTLFFERMGGRCGTILVDDADDRDYRAWLDLWCKQTGRRMDVIEERAALIRHQEQERTAA